MTTDVVSATLRPGLARPQPRTRIRLEHVVMGGAIVALIVLVVLPLCSLLLGSVKGEQGLSLDHFEEVLSGRLYVNALKNSLILGAWTGLFSLVIGLVLAWAVSRTDVPAKPLIQITATLSYLSPPFLTAIAFTYLFSPNAGLINVLLRDVAGLPWLTFNVFSMPGLVLVTVLHTFPFVYLLASSALLSVDASYEEAAQILGAGKLRTALSITAPLVAPAILSGTLLAFVNALALFGSQAIIGLPGRIFTLPTRIYALFDYPPEYGLASALSLVLVLITVVADPAERLKALSDASPYSLDLRISIDGWDAASNDPIRGDGTFERILEGIRNLAEAGLSPVLTVTEACDGAATAEGRTRFLGFLREVGLLRPRLKVMPLLRLGAETQRSRAYESWETLRGRTLTADEAEALQCSSCRMATEGGVYVCPILLDFPGARMADSLKDTLRPFELKYRACYTCHEQGLSCRT